MGEVLHECTVIIECPQYAFALGARGWAPFPNPFMMSWPHFSSTGYFARDHSRHPPFRAKTFVNPFLISACATRALVNSFGQAQ